MIIVNMRIFLAAVVAALLWGALIVRGKADQSSGWVDQLQDQRANVCCSNNDGQRIGGPDWDTLGTVSGDINGPSGFRVYEDGEWLEVPNFAVVKAKNQDGIPRVWWDRHYDQATGVTSKKVRCFLPGSFS